MVMIHVEAPPYACTDFHMSEEMLSLGNLMAQSRLEYTRISRKIRAPLLLLNEGYQLYDAH